MTRRKGDDEALLVTVELPGVSPKELVVSTHGGDVILAGEKSRPEVSGSVRSHVAERAYGRFRRVVHLGVPVNTHKAEAVLAHGTLRSTRCEVQSGVQLPIHWSMTVPVRTEPVEGQLRRPRP